MAINECIPKYEPGADLTGHCSAGVTGRRFLVLSADKQGVEAVSDGTTGGNIVVALSGVDGAAIGVAGYDAASGKKVKIVRGYGKVVPVESGGAINFGDFVKSDSTGRAIAHGGTGRAVGRCLRTVGAAGQFPLIELLPPDPVDIP
jgi:hypothetical protein